MKCAWCGSTDLAGSVLAYNMKSEEQIICKKCEEAYVLNWHIKPPQGQRFARCTKCKAVCVKNIGEPDGECIWCQTMNGSMLNEWTFLEDKQPWSNSFVQICYYDENGNHVIERVHEKFIDRKKRNNVLWKYDVSEERKDE